MVVFRRLLTATICGLLLACGAAFAFAAPHIVVDVRSGKILSEQQPFDRWYPASLTKLMTVYTAFKAIGSGEVSKLSPVKVSAHALAQPPSKMGFPKGTVMNIDTAIKILMVKSANDISVALAEAVAGGEAAFVARMNAHAASLGMSETRFANPHGLFHPDQYTSARDMAVLALALKREFPQHAGYFKIPAIRHGGKVLQNHNPLLQRFRGTTGMKTGYVCESGLNIVASARRGGRELIAVVLGGPTGQERNVRAAKLLSEGFRRSPLFASATIQTPRPAGMARAEPVNLRPVVCGGKKPAAKAAAATATFALSKPSLDELESRYLSRVGHDGRVVPIVLGNASGPDPYNLVVHSESQAPAAYVAEAAASAAWPTVFGKRRVKVPLPTPRPR
jgi:D-alanyl-D-alanine carboxypeptidase